MRSQVLIIYLLFLILSMQQDFRIAIVHDGVILKSRMQLVILPFLVLFLRLY